MTILWFEDGYTESGTDSSHPNGLRESTVVVRPVSCAITPITVATSIKMILPSAQAITASLNGMTYPMVAPATKLYREMVYPARIRKITLPFSLLPGEPSQRRIPIAHYYYSDFP